MDISKKVTSYPEPA